MNYRYTLHAQARIAERGIPAEWMEKALSGQAQVLAAPNGREVRQMRFERDGKSWLLRVIVEGDLIISAMLTSKVDKYGGQ